MSFSSLLKSDFADQFHDETQIFSKLNSVLSPILLDRAREAITLSEAGIQRSRQLATREAAEAERLLRQLEAGMSDSDLSSLRLAGEVNE